jgi:hypothetical protein
MAAGGLLIPSALLVASVAAAEVTAVVAWEGAVEAAVFDEVDERVLALKVSLTGDFGVGSSLPPIESLVFFFLRRPKVGMVTGGGGQCGECRVGVGASDGAQLARRGQRKQCARAMQMPEYDSRALVSRWSSCAADSLSLDKVLVYGRDCGRAALFQERRCKQSDR